MAEYDAGTARGRFRLDADSRGVDAVNRSMDGFRRAMEGVRGRVGGFNESLNRAEAELRNIRRDFNEAERAAKDFDRSVDGIDVKMRRNSSSTKQWTSDLGELHSRLKGLNETAAFFGPIGLQVGRFAREMNNLRGTDTSMLTRLATSFVRVGAASTVLSVVKGRILGTGAALALAPVWAQQMVRFASSFQLLTFGVGIITRLDLVSKAWLGTARLLGRVSTDAGLGMIKLGDGIAKVAAPLIPAVSWLAKLNQSLDNMAGGVIRTTIGMGLLRSGITGLSRNFGLFTGNIQTGNRYLDIFARALRFLLVPGVLLSSAAMQGLGQVLILTSNLLVGLWDGIKQLAGGLLAIPGAVAIAATAIGTLKVIFSELKDSFKSLIKDISAGDMTKVAEDLGKLPPYLRDLGNALVETIPKWKELQRTLTQTFIQGGADQLRTFTANYVPVLAIGGQRVANAWKIARERLGEFAGESRTVGAVNSIFGSTAQTMNSVSRAMVPALEGFRDLAVVGAKFISTLSSGLPGLTDRFAQWAQGMAESGRATTLMNNAVQGAKDLFHGLENAIKGAWGILTIFKTNTGQGFLRGFAEEMQKFNDAVQKSAQGGFLRRIGDEVRGLGTDKLRELISIFKELMPAVQAVVHMLSQAGSVMTTIMVPVVELLASGLTQLVQVMNQLGIGPILGTVLGLATAFKVLFAVLGPVINLIKIFAGIKALWSGFETIILNMAGAMERFGSMGQKASNGLLGIGEKIRGMAGGITAAVAAIIIVYSEWASRNKYIADGNNTIAETARHAADGVNALRAAFAQDQGQIGAHVTDQFRQNITQAFSDIDSQAQKAPGIMDHVAEMFRVDSGTKSLNPFAQSDAFNDMQKMFDHAKDVKAGLDQLKVSATDVADAITRGSPAIDQWANQLQGMGDSGKAAADFLEEQKRAFDNMAASAKAAGPAALLVAQGVSEIAKAGGDANSKLEGLKHALEGLGLLQTDKLQAAFDFAEQIRGLGDAAQKAADGSQDLDNVINRSNGSFNTGTVAAKNLFDTLKPMMETFLRLASQGEDVNSMWARMGPELDKVANSFHITRDELNNLLAQMGGDPKVVSILVQLQGKDDIAQELSKILATAEANVGKGVQVPVSFGTEQAAKDAAAAMDQIFGPNSVIQQGATIFLKPGIDQAAITRFEQYLADKYHIQISPTGPQPTPAPMPVAPTGPGLAPVPPAGPPPPEPKKGEKAPGQPPAPAPPPQFQPPMDQGGVPPPAAPAPQGPQHVQVVVDGMDAVAQIPALVQAAMTASIPFINEIRTTFASVFGDSLTIAHKFGDDLVAGFGTLGHQLHDAGVNMIHQLAEGIRSAGDDVQRAATDAAHVVAEVLVHKSPPKKGPLSGDGWLKLSGAKAIADFASGMKDSIATVVGSATGVASAIRPKLMGDSLDPIAPGDMPDPPDTGRFNPNIKIDTSMASVAPPEIPDFGGPQDNVGPNGQAYAQSFADGIQAGTPSVIDAIERLTKEAADYLPHSPAKKGPLSGSGSPEASGLATAGGFAAGITAGVPAVAGAATKIASSVQGKLTPYGNFTGAPQMDSNYLGQLSKILDFVSQGLGLVKSMGDTFLSFAGNQDKHKDDRAAAGLGQEGGGGAGGGKGSVKLPGVEALGANPSRDDIVTAIVGESLKRGMSIHDATAVVADGLLESTLNPSAKNGDHIGLFQQDSGYPGRATAGGQISGLLDRLQQGPQTGSIWDRIARVESGGYSGGQLQKQFGSQAQGLIDALDLNSKIGQNQVALGQGQYGVNPATQAATGTSSQRVGENTIRQWAQAMFGIPNSIGTGSWENATHPKDQGFHPQGLAFDFHGSRQQMDAMANYIAHNLAGQTLELIYQSSSFDPANVIKNTKLGSAGVYGAATLGDHNDHVHWATDVAPILANANASALPAAAGQEPTQTLTQDDIHGYPHLGPGPAGKPGPGVLTDSQNQNLIDISDNTSKTANDIGDVKDTQGKGGDFASKTPIEQAQQVFGAATGIAGDVVDTLKAGLETIAATKNLTDILVRGPSNTEDIMKIIDDFQKYIDFAAKLTKSIGDIVSTAGSFSGGADFGGTAAAGQAMQLISAVLEGINTAIDLGQEAWHIFGSYFGGFLGMLAGGTGGLMGDVKFLLDQNTGQLLAYSADNPMLKTPHPIPGAIVNPNATNQTIGQLNYYAGPGQDPRDSTRQMMYQVKASQMNTVTAA